MISKKLTPFGTTIFAEMTKLAIECEAINLAQGFPDFDGPAELIDAADAAMRAGRNQYARSMGALELCRAVSSQRRRDYGLDYDPTSEVLVTSGATEGIAAAMLGLLDPGDEVILFEPYYDSYPACVAMAGAVPRFCTLRFPDFRLDFEHFASLVNEKTKLIVLNSPHNPTGKVFDREELDAIAAAAKRHDVIVLTDEVYEHLLFDAARHVPIATLPGMRERTLSLSSAGKTYSMTGWKVGWGTGPSNLVAACQAAHQFLTFSTVTPFQFAVAHALEHLGPSFYAALRAEYDERRRFLMTTLERAGFTISEPRGAYFVLADFSKLSSDDDRTFAKELTRKTKVAAIPPSVFYTAAKEEGRRLVRFAFCKRMSTLAAAAERLEGINR